MNASRERIGLAVDWFSERENLVRVASLSVAAFMSWQFLKPKTRRVSLPVATQSTACSQVSQLISRFQDQIKAQCGHGIEGPFAVQYVDSDGAFDVFRVSPVTAGVFKKKDSAYSVRICRNDGGADAMRKSAKKLVKERALLELLSSTAEGDLRRQMGCGSIRLPSMKCVVANERICSFAIYEWIKGCTLQSADCKQKRDAISGDLEQLASFLASVHTLGTRNAQSEAWQSLQKMDTFQMANFWREFRSLFEWLTSSRPLAGLYAAINDGEVSDNKWEAVDSVLQAIRRGLIPKIADRSMRYCVECEFAAKTKCKITGGGKKKCDTIVVTHGDLSPEHLITDLKHTGIGAVVGWSDARQQDVAVDLAGVWKSVVLKHMEVERFLELYVAKRKGLEAGFELCEVCTVQAMCRAALLGYVCCCVDLCVHRAKGKDFSNCKDAVFITAESVRNIVTSVSHSFAC